MPFHFVQTRQPVSVAHEPGTYHQVVESPPRLSAPWTRWTVLVLAVILLAVGFLTAGPGFARADTLEVCKSGCAYETIIGALGGAEPGDTVWVRAGDYREREPVRLRPGVTVRGEDPEHPYLTVIRVEEGNAVVGTGRMLTTTCVLEGFTIIGGTGRAIYIQDGATEIIRNNVISGCITHYQGAAIRIDDEGTAPTIMNNVFSNNSTSDQGGAIYVCDASPLIVGNKFMNNHSDKDGGALAIRTIDRPGQQAIVANNQFISNTASAKGGAIYLEQSQPRIQGNHIVSNTALAGAGIYVNSYCSAGKALIHSNWIAHNKTHGMGWDSVGGALAIANRADSLVDGNTIRQNTAWRGDGVYIDDSVPVLTNNVIIANGQAEILVNDGSPHIVNNTILGASTESTVGIEILGLSRPRVVNNIIAFEGYGIRCDGMAVPTIVYNDAWMSLVAHYTGVHVGSTNLSADPHFADPAIEDYHLDATSPLIDAGTTDGAPSIDLDGESRPIDGNGDGIAVADIGADEYAPPSVTATPVATSTPSRTATPGATSIPTETAKATSTAVLTLTATPGPSLSCVYLPVIWKQ